MDRLWIGVVLLAVLLVGVLSVGAAMESIHEPLTGTLEEAARVTLAGDLDQGVALGIQAKDAWQRYRSLVAAAIDQTPMDEIDGLFAELECYAISREAPDFAACCARLSSLVAAVGDAHVVTWWNLL